ncbi:hypothetical protein DFO63_4141 [Stenotrophomonas sp. AG209]|uniref:hypothetical protein n=1 Tax=Stenotrophomonas sp. AG209 TaxID=2183909 RepID=UPI000E5AAC0B|nr:hypothetical protein [Stenotrophomonas sp. AG209]RIA19023.1 hypothetical protein DFO63_4141 [Stenotrophomonas sp. AG209]
MNDVNNACSCPSGDGTLHGPIDHWQERALRAEAELAARQPVGDHLAQDRKMVSQPAASNQLSGNSGELDADGARQPVGHVPAGFVLVPKQFGIPAEAWDAAAFAFGGPSTGEDQPFLDCTAWIGEITGDDGEKAHGLHISCDECPEEGSITLAEFAAPPAQAVGLSCSLDADPAGIRARVCDVITGTLMVGAQGHTPPPAGHWAEPFWQAASADAAVQAVDLGQFQEVVSAVNTRLQSVIGDNMMPWSERDKASKEQAALYPLLALIDSQAVCNG